MLQSIEKKNQTSSGGGGPGSSSSAAGAGGAPLPPFPPFSALESFPPFALVFRSTMIQAFTAINLYTVGTVCTSHSSACHVSLF